MATEGWTKHKLWEKPLYPFRVLTGLQAGTRLEWTHVKFTRILDGIFVRILARCPFRCLRFRHL
jgi:hypothetical protein